MASLKTSGNSIHIFAIYLFLFIMCESMYSVHSSFGFQFFSLENNWFDFFFLCGVKSKSYHKREP